MTESLTTAFDPGRMDDPAYEGELLDYPVENKDILYDLYKARLQRIADRAKESPELFDVSDFFAQCNRIKIVETLFPAEDSRSYEVFMNS